MTPLLARVTRDEEVIAHALDREVADVDRLDRVGDALPALS